MPSLDLLNLEGAEKSGLEFCRGKSLSESGYFLALIRLLWLLSGYPMATSWLLDSGKLATMATFWLLFSVNSTTVATLWILDGYRI